MQRNPREPRASLAESDQRDLWGLFLRGPNARDRNEMLAGELGAHRACGILFHQRLGTFRKPELLDHLRSG